MTNNRDNRATEEELADVHNGMARWCIQIMQGVPLLDKEGNAVLMPDGQPWLVPPSPAHLNVIRQFLKDNDIQAEPAKGSPMGDLGDLPVFEDDVVRPIRKAQ